MDNKYKNAIISLISSLKFLYFTTGFFVSICTLPVETLNINGLNVILYIIFVTIFWLPLTITSLISKI